MSSLKNRCLFVFDINGVLIKRAKDENQRKMAEKLQVPIICGEFIFLRPYSEKLCKFFDINQEFCDYAFWTAAREVYCSLRIEYIKPAGFINPKFSWHQSSCKIKEYDANDKPLYVKNLSQVWNVYESEYEKENVILIDDDAYKSAHNENFIHISKYNVDNEECVKGDETLKKLVDYLEIMKTSLQDKKYNDCVSFMKENMF